MQIKFIQNKKLLKECKAQTKKFLNYDSYACKSHITFYEPYEKQTHKLKSKGIKKV